MASHTKKQLEETLAIQQEKLAEVLEDRRHRTDAPLAVQDRVDEAKHWLEHHSSFGNRSRAIAYALGILEGSQMRLPCPCQRKGGE